MGMYDYLKIPAEMLPVSDEDKNSIGEVGFGGWQTKDFDCLMEYIEIHKDGTISKYVKENKLDYTGAVRFYGYIFDDWYDFTALFDKGKLQSIVGGKDGKQDADY